MSLSLTRRIRCSAGKRAWSRDAAARPAGRSCVRGTGSGGRRPAGPGCGLSPRRPIPDGGERTPRWPAAGHRDAVTASGGARICASGMRARGNGPGCRICAAGWTGCRAARRLSAPAGCLISSCQLWAEPGSHWCRWHGVAWKRRGRPPAAEFAAGWAAGVAAPGYERRIRLGGLPAQLKLEVQYALQRRHDERAAKAPPIVVMAAVRFLAASGASSLLDRTEQEWRDQSGGSRSNAAALLAWFRRQVADLAEGTGWDAEYRRDTWQMHRLGYGARRVLDFSGIPQPQLKDLAKRWIRWRLSTGLAWMPAAPAAARPDPVRGVPGRARHHRHQRHRPRRARGLPRRPAGHDGRQAAAGQPHRHDRRVPHRDPPARLGPCPAGDRDVLSRGPAPPRRAAAPGPGRARDDPGRGSRQPRQAAQPGIPAGHAHLDPLRPAGLRRAAAAPSTASSPTTTAPPTCAITTTR